MVSRMRVPIHAKDASGRLIQNRLYHLQEDPKIKSNAYPDDIDDQGLFSPSLTDINTKNNYQYDALGNLIADKQAGIAQIKWSLSGKMLEIIRQVGDKRKNIKFDYDPMGNRVAKEIYSSTGIWEQTEYYFRDASGTLVSTYRYAPDPLSQMMSFAQIEKIIYGHKRLGTENSPTELIAPLPLQDVQYNRVLGTKQYEGSNHLGNVMAVYTDKKYPISTNNVSISHYIPDVISSTDYYPFGAPMNGRNFSTSSYRFGFNGKEKDDEVKSVSGGSLDFGARMYDARVGRWLSIDPLAAQYPFASPYHFALNTPIQAKDPDGKLVVFVNGYHNGFLGLLGLGFNTFSKLDGNPQGYWHGMDMKFRERIGDQNAYYTDGGTKNAWSSYQNRYIQGLNEGVAMIQKIKSGDIKIQFDENGKPTETIKIVMHSQGVAKGNGMSDALTAAGYKVEVAYDIAGKQLDKAYPSSAERDVQYGSDKDFIAPQFNQLGIKEQYQLSDDKKTFESGGGHRVEQYNEIFDITQNKPGYVVPRKDNPNDKK